MSILKMIDNVVTTLAHSFLIESTSFLQVTLAQVIHKSLDEFEFQAEPTLDCGVNCP